MTEKKIPDAETRRRSVQRLRESNRQLDLWGLQIDELIAMADARLLLGKSRSETETVEQ